MKKRTILIVDDEYYNAEVLAFVLEDEGYRVLCAANGEDALEKLRRTAIDLVIADLMMPIMDGAELGKAMRQDAALAAIPLILNSALPEARVRQSFDQFDAFLRKSFQMREALAQVCSLLAGEAGQ